jgi:hypothetical protein
MYHTNALARNPSVAKQSNESHLRKIESRGVSMGQENALVLFFALIIVIFVIALVITLVGLVRARRRLDGVRHGEPGIEEGKQPIAERLGEQYPGQFGADPRGEDVGGNFSTVSPEEENKYQR